LLSFIFGASSVIYNFSGQGMKIIDLVPNDFLNITPEMLSLYKKLVLEKFWVCLEGKDPWGVEGSEIYGALANDDEGNPLGIALATYRRNISWATLLCLPLNISADKGAVSAALLKRLQEILLQNHCHIFSHIYSNTTLEAPQIESLFQQAGWNPPQLFMVRYHFDVDAFHPDWFQRYQQASLPAGVKMFHWAQLSSTERKQVHALEEQSRFPLFVSPFHDEGSIEPLNSLGMVYKGSVIGWIITNHIDSNTICYSSFWVAPEFRNTKAPICLLAKSIALQQKSNVKKSVVEFNLSQIDHKWIAFAKKRLAPHTQSIERLYEVTRYLQEEEEEEG
jgi:hypothetical protein